MLRSTRANDPRSTEAPETDMIQTQTRSGPNLGLLLLIPAVVIIAKAAAHRHPGRARFAGPDGEMGPRTLRLPPRIEAALDAWHSRAHAVTQPGTSQPSANED